MAIQPSTVTTAPIVPASMELDSKDAPPPTQEPSTPGIRNSEATGSDNASLMYYDQRDMQRMGKKQELHRNFRLLSSIAFTSCVMGTWELLLCANNQGLLIGGPAGVFWSLVWAYIGQMFIVLSLAEMASIAPTAGGQYHWVSEFAPRTVQKTLSYASGWLSTLALQSFLAVNCFLVARIVLGMIVLSHETFVPRQWHVTLLIMATVLGLATFNLFAGKHLALAETIFAAFHLLAVIPIVAVLLTLTPEKQSAMVVFTYFGDNVAGWSSMSLAVMIWSYILNMPLTFAILLSFLFCIDDVYLAVDSPTSFAFMYVFRKAAGTAPRAMGLVYVVLVLNIFVAASVFAVTSRQLFAFARDDGVPASGWFAKVCTALDHLFLITTFGLLSCSYSFVYRLQRDYLAADSSLSFIQSPSDFL
ncbi:MAG: hypothetical protein Q9195_009485 [Heterodermia aff. obscurata]